MSEPTVPQAFAAALDGLIRQVEKDKSVLAAILCGSLAHDTVWARSDIDLVLVTIDDRLVPHGDIPLYADGVNGSAPVRQEMTRVQPLTGAASGAVYRAQVPATRPATDYTARVIPDYPGSAVPLEAAHILWQR